MITLNSYRGKTVGVFGLGQAGRASVSALVAGGAKVVAFDDKAASRDALKQSDGENVSVIPPARWPWEDLAAVVLSPGIPLTHPAPHKTVLLAREYHVPVIGDIELLYQTCPYATYVAITGTNGKSTTTALVGHILKTCGKRVEVGGNIGTAVLSLEALGQGEIYVLELSSYQLDLVATARLNVAVLLNISPDHLDRHGSMEGYIHAKTHLFDHQTRHDTAIIAVDDDYTRGIAAALERKQTVPVTKVSAAESLEGGVYAEAGILHDRTGESHQQFDLNNIRTLRGQHNWQNALAAYAAARAVRLEPEAIYAAMQTFPGLAHRMEWLGEKAGVQFVNDSKATNADATSHALKAYENIYWVAGGRAKFGGIQSLAPYFPKIARAYLIGEAAEQFADTLEGKVLHRHCETLNVAVEQAFRDASAEGRSYPVVLLSPAAASFDQFANFEARGEAFRRLVAGIGGQDSG